MSKNFVPIDQFGKDHWSLLAYIETRCVDFNRGVDTCEINHDHLRCNIKQHPTLQGPRQRLAKDLGWKPSYGTRLKEFKSDKNLQRQLNQLHEHDDWDCLDDLENAGLIEVISVVNGFIKITNAGKKINTLIRDHKSAGGSFSSFELLKNNKEETVHA